MAVLVLITAFTGGDALGEAALVLSSNLQHNDRRPSMAPGGRWPADRCGNAHCGGHGYRANIHVRQTCAAFRFFSAGEAVEIGGVYSTCCVFVFARTLVLSTQHYENLLGTPIPKNRAAFPPRIAARARSSMSVRARRWRQESGNSESQWG